MKRLSITLLLCCLVLTPLRALEKEPGLKANFKTGDPGIKSINALAFGPEGILFIGDSEKAEIIALDTREATEVANPDNIEMKKVDQQMASLLGTKPEDIIIQDMAINPLSKMIYFAIHTSSGQAVLMKTAGKTLELVPLDQVSFSKISLEKAVSQDAKDRRGRPLRKWAISDLSFYKNQVMVSGLSNEEFSSTFRMIPFPFKETQDFASLEIYHAAHGRYETYAPIKTFMPYQMQDQDYLVASYTCTPLVIFPLNTVKKGAHLKGKTVAELGNRNTPLDIVSYKKKGKEYILLANSSRALMKLDPEKIAAYKAYLTEPVTESSATAGVEFIALPYVQVQQMAKMSDSQIVLLQRMANGDLNLHSPDVRRL